MSESMTPPTKAVKRATRSPLTSMDDDDDEALELQGEGNVGLSVATVANIVRSEIQRGIAPVEQQLATLQSAFGDRLGQLESSVSAQGSRIQKLEQVMASADGTPRSTASDHSAKIEKQISDLFAQMELLREPPVAIQHDYTRTMVVGGLQGLTSLQQATLWLSKTLNSLSGPSHVGAYMKSKVFQGLMFAKFKSTTDRDIAVALLRSAELTEAGNRVWATQDLPLEKRTRKTFLLGLKWQLGEWGFMKREIEIDDDYSQLKVGSSVVLTLSIVGTHMQCNWVDTWAQWEDLQTSEELKQLLARASNSLQKMGGAKGRGKSKSGVAEATS